MWRRRRCRPPQFHPQKANISLNTPRTKNKNKQQLAVVSALIMPVGALISFFSSVSLFQCYNISVGPQRCSVSADANCLHVRYIKAGLTRVNTASGCDCSRLQKNEGRKRFLFFFLSDHLLTGRCCVSPLPVMA